MPSEDDTSRTVQVYRCNCTGTESVYDKDTGAFSCSYCGLLIDDVPVCEIEEEIVMYDRVIKASEDWSNEYTKNPTIHSKLIKLEAKLESDLRRYFRELAGRIDKLVIWSYYSATVKAAYKVDVMVYDDGLAEEDEIIAKILYEPIQLALQLGQDFGGEVYRITLTDTQTMGLIERATRQRIAELVGKKFDEFGNLIDNPKAKYRISDTTRDSIEKSIRTSLDLGESVPKAVERLQTIIKDPKRATMIASTESVNGFQRGMYDYANTAGYKTKQWDTVGGACPVCLENQAAGKIPIDEAFPSGDFMPTAHPHDRCSLSYDR